MLREGEQLRMNYDYPFYNFILVTLSYLPDENPCSVLQVSLSSIKKSRRGGGVQSPRGGIAWSDATIENDNKK